MVEGRPLHGALEHHLTGDLDALGVPHLDVSVVRSEHRLLTRLIATCAYRAAAPETNYAMYSSIRYVSKIGNHECWAIFEGTELPLLDTGPIDGNDHAYRVAHGTMR